MTHLNHLKTLMGAATVALTFTFTPSAIAQQQGGMSEVDMQMMNHCAQVRQQVQQSPGVPHPAEVQQILAQCDQMDLMNSQMNHPMNNQPGMNPAQQAPWPQH